MSESLIGKNIKYLRKAYGETQLELALALGLNSSNTISNYEKGVRLPKSEVRKKIAVHYRITEDELLYTDFSKIRSSEYKLNDRNKMIDMTLTVLPIICTETALKDKDFEKGYKAHLQAVEEIKFGKTLSEFKFDKCIDAYAASYDKNETPEALCNIIWWFLLTEISMCNQWALEGAEELKRKNMNSKVFIKNYYLCDCSEDVISENMSDEECQSVYEMDDTIIELLQVLRKDRDYYELTDYYIALRYVLGCVKNELTIEFNKTIGAEMMYSFALLNNKYALELLKSGLENTKKTFNLTERERIKKPNDYN